jgi:glycosyltransferase involved in cell wall biosynthesis
MTVQFENQLRIGIDGGQLAEPNTGIGRYTLELCRALDSLLPNAKFFVYSKHPIAAPVVSSRWTIRVEPNAKARRLHDLLWMTFRCSSICAGDDVDIFWGARTLLPALRSSTRCIVTVYDMFHLHRELVSLKRWLSYRWFIDRALKRANVIVTISNDTASELRRLRGYQSHAVIRPAVSSNFRPCSESKIQNCLRHYGLSKPYFLNTARWDPKKNLDVLLRAFTGMKKDGLIPGYSLALAGGPIGKYKSNARLRTLIDESRQAGVTFLGRVTEDRLPALYAGSEAFVLTSTHEGFGMPVLEARACGTRIVASDIDAVREAGENDAIYVPSTESGIRAGILQALSSPNRSAAGVRLWTWRDSGEFFVRALLGDNQEQESNRFSRRYVGSISRPAV